MTNQPIMTVFVTPDHDTSMVSSPTQTMPTDAQLRAIEDAINLSESTEFDESELDAELFGDEYADAMLMDLYDDTTSQW